MDMALAIGAGLLTLAPLLFLVFSVASVVLNACTEEDKWWGTPAWMVFWICGFGPLMLGAFACAFGVASLVYDAVN